jgi:hypothetical protein
VASVPVPSPPAAAPPRPPRVNASGPEERRPLPPAPRRSSAELSEERVRELHARLVEAKRQTKEAGNVPLSGFESSIRDAESKLRTKYAGRKIEFDIVIKDGKAIVKPIVR